MEPQKDNPTEAESVANQPESNASSVQDAPSDALSRTPDDLAQEQANEQVAQPATATELANGAKPASPLKTLFRKINLYFLLFLLIVSVAAVITVVNYLNSQKGPVESSFANQEMTKEALQQLSNRDASVGSAAQTLTIQGNTVIDGQTLMRGDLNVAGNIQTAGKLAGASLTVSGASNLGELQANSLQVAQNTAIEGSTTLRDLSVSGSASFSGAMTASQISVSRLVLSGNAVLQIPNHISFTGPSPNRTINPAALGSGGSASVNGSDTSGTVNISTGNRPQAGCFVTINFNQAYSNQPHVLVSPVGSGAGRTDYYVERSQSSFSICAATPAPGNQAFAFDYFVTN